jgi:hypothetical protein
MHDWWLAIIAAHTGEILYLDQPLVQYRQHESNVIGAKRISLASYTKFKSLVLLWRNGNNELLATMEQAKAVLSHLNNKNVCEAKNLKYMEMYAKLRHLNRIRRVLVAMKLPIWKVNPLMRIVFFIRILLGSWKYSRE